MIIKKETIFPFIIGVEEKLTYIYLSYEETGYKTCSKQT